MNDSSAHSIVWRMEDCLRRTLSNFQQLTALHTEVFHALDQEKDSVEDILARLENRPFNPESQEEEYRILKNEWDSTSDIPDPDRLRMRLLGEDLQLLSRDLQISYERLATLAQAQARDLRRELDEMKRMGNTMNKYRPGGDEDSTGFDSKA